MMKATVVILSIVGTLAAAARAPVPDAERAFDEFVRAHGRRYQDATERSVRLHSFTESLSDAARRNEDPEELAEFGITKFSDYTNEEFLPAVTEDDIENLDTIQMEYNFTEINYPEKLDWRDHNAVTPVRDQGDCNASYAFAVAAAMESQYAILTHGKMLTLSVQQLVSCFPLNKKCEGGYSRNFYKRKDLPISVEKESDYPYEGKSSECKADKNKEYLRILSAVYYRMRNEQKLIRPLCHVGPVVVSIDGSTLKNYKGGILSVCPFNSPNLELVLVGYGKEKDVPYWILKTSFGTDFGENGYIRIKRDVDACGISTYAKRFSVPIIY